MNKKLTSIVLTLAMVSSVLFAIPLNASAKEVATIESYKVILEELNEKYNTSLYIPNDTEVYNNILNMSIEDFKTKMEQNCQTAISIEKEVASEVDDSMHIDSTSTNRVKSSIRGGISVDSIRESITQRSTKETSKYFVDVFMTSQVFSANGTTYTYSSITKLGAYGHTDKAYFTPSIGKSYSLSSDKKTCTATYNGTVKSPEGVVMLTSLKVTVKFTANASSGVIL